MIIEDYRGQDPVMSGSRLPGPVLVAAAADADPVTSRSRAQAPSFRTPLVNAYFGQIFIVGLPECLIAGGRMV
jgi:hypothetical protein